jgi:hypothetical protein
LRTVPNNGDRRKKPAKEIKRYRVPKEYFAVYNLAYDLTSSVGVFDRAVKSNDYQMQGTSAETAIGIFSVQSEAPTPFTDCFCAMPRWYRVAHYNLFALAWNDLVQHVGDIVNDLYSDSMPHNYLLSDWAVLSLLRIHICIAMNYAPFIVSEDEIKQIRERITNDPDTPWREDDKILEPIKAFVKEGLSRVMRQIRSDSQKRVLLKHQRAFSTWVEYGLPMLSSGEYVSATLGQWIVNQWIDLLMNDEEPNCFEASACRKRCNFVINEKYGIVANDESTNEILKPSCRNCCYSRLWLIYTMIHAPVMFSDQRFDKNKHNSLFFLQEYVVQRQLQNSLINGPLDKKLTDIFSSFSNVR